MNFSQSQASTGGTKRHSSLLSSNIPRLTHAERERIGKILLGLFNFESLLWLNSLILIVKPFLTLVLLP